MASDTEKYRFRFFRAGGVDQVVLDAGALDHIEDLDETLWLALACPTRGLELDARTLDLVDTDGDGRIRPPEVIAATKWARQAFARTGDLLDPLEGDEVALDAFAADTDVGRALRDKARRILSNLGRADEKTIKLSDVLDTERIFAQTKLNGDGVVPVHATDDEDLRRLIADVIAVLGGVTDRSGAPGVDKAKADTFFEQVAVYAAWLASADDDVRVVGDATDAAYEAFITIKTKVDDYFLRASLIVYASELAPRLTAWAPEGGALAATDLGANDDEIAKWPLAHVASGGLPLEVGVNPAWKSRLDTMCRSTLAPLLGAAPRVLTEAAWRDVEKRLAPYAAWLATKPSVAAGALGAARVREITGSDLAQRLYALIAEDLALEGESSGLEAVEMAIRLRRDLVTLLRNFLNFADFYGKRRGIFQAGTLYIDGRSCELCLPVHDVAKHATLAGLAKAYLVYCDCTRKGEEKRIIVAAVTAGHVDNILVGRNGVFYDRKGHDWDATITKIIENPISVRQAILAPYKRFLRVVEEQVAKRASAADAENNAKLDGHAALVATTGTSDAAGSPVPPAAPAKKIDIGTVAAIGVAVGGFATFCSSVFATFLGLGMWMPFGVVALLLAISGPSMIIAWLKLSERNIGPVLDANGWAVNAFARINIPFGGALTKTAELPKGATRLLDDPFAEHKPPYRRYATLAVLLFIILLWASGRLDALLPRQAQLRGGLLAPGGPALSAAPSAPPTPPRPH